MRFGPLPSSTLRTSFDPLTRAFEAQRAAILDPATFVTCTTSGRAGKTTAALLKWHHTRLAKPGRTSIFVALTREHAKSIVWQELKRQNEEWGLGLEFKEAELVVYDAAGSCLRLLGANRDDLVDTLRGFPLVLCIFDEAAFIRRGLLERCVDEAIYIRLLDHGGQCWVTSTPGYLRSGWFYRVSTGTQPGWARHRWSIYDNPHLPKDESLTEIQRDMQKRAWIVDECARKGWTDATPGYQREFLGEWAHDEASLVYPVSAANLVPRMPDSWLTDRGSWHTVIGIDYGVKNPTTHALLAWNDYDYDVYVVRSRSDAGIDAESAAKITQQWRTDEEPVAIVGDAGGLGAAYVLTANERFGLCIEPADKLGKRGHQRWLADALQFKPTPRLYVVEPDNLPLLTQMEQLGWEAFPAEDPRYRAREDPRAPNDLCDCVLYAFTKCRSYWPTERTQTKIDPDDAPRDASDWRRFLG